MGEDVPLLSPTGEGRTAWVLTDGKIGDEIPIRGVAEAMGLSLHRRTVRPRELFAAFAPWGPADPADIARLFVPPYPSLAFAAGRRAVPYLRRLKRLSPRTFTVFFGSPRSRRHGADLFWTPAHDGLTGAGVIVTETAPHPYGPATMAAVRQAPDPRVAALPQPRLGLLIGGDSRHHRFAATDVDALVALARIARAQGYSLAATVSRRTPPTLAATLRAAFADDAGALLWNGDGENPYPSILALADALVVSADSTNMVGEAVATGAPVHLFEPSGGNPRLTLFHNALIARGAIRRWSGRIERWSYDPIDSTPVVAAEIARRLLAFQQARGA